MREILFRGRKLTDNERWVEGGYAELGVGEGRESYIIQNNSIVGAFEKEQYNKTFSDYRVDPETVCQYTGLTDKNGRKIFEGDIVMVHNNDIDEEYHTFLVEWDDSARFILCGYRFYVDFDNCSVEKCEVIGNKFDSPELLE